MDDAECDWFPLEEAQHEAQVRGLLRSLRAAGAAQRDLPILDLGCGDGRVLAPLADAGLRVVGVDADKRALARCRARLGERPATLIHADFLSDELLEQLRPLAPFQMALCLGNTFLLVHDVDRAATLLGRLRDLLRPGGAIYLDNFCAETWREVAEGYWQEGISEDGAMQLLWSPGDNVIALRRGEAVAETDDQVRPSDTLYRLWTRGELRLLARSCGLCGPEIDEAQHLIRLLRSRRG